MSGKFVRSSCRNAKTEWVNCLDLGQQPVKKTMAYVSTPYTHPSYFLIRIRIRTSYFQIFRRKFWSWFWSIQFDSIYLINVGPVGLGSPGELCRAPTPLEQRKVEQDVAKSAFDAYMDRLTQDEPEAVFKYVSRCYSCSKKRKIEENRMTGCGLGRLFCEVGVSLG